MNLRPARTALVGLALTLLAWTGGTATALAAEGGQQADAHWGDDVVIAKGTTAPSRVLAFGANLLVEGDVQGDVVALFGDVVVRGRVTGDALALLGSVRVEGPSAHVGGSAIALAGTVGVADLQAVDGEVRGVLPGWSADGRGWMGFAFSRAGLVARFTVTLLAVMAALLAALAAPRLVVAASSALERHPWRLLGIGTLAHGLALVLALVCTALVLVFVGLPLLVLLGLAMAVLTGLGFAAVFHRAGDALLRLRAGTASVSGYARVLLGLLAFAVVQFLPYLGEVAWLAAALAGTGAVLAARRAKVPAAA